MRPIYLLASMIFAAFILPALALPAPMSEQELNDKSDIVAVVRVLSVTCTAVTPDEKTGEELPSYMAQLRMIDVKRGDAKKGDVVLVTWRAVPSKIVGPWTVYYYPGEEVLTHLTKKSGGVSYGSTWWNAKGDDITKPESVELPKAPGQTVVPRGAKQDQVPL
ncbi:MAG TPA: hypothetical protein VIG26_02100 [Methyloceanibacter sp.]|jgi:hypothetical protein